MGLILIPRGVPPAVVLNGAGCGNPLTNACVSSTFLLAFIPAFFPPQGYVQCKASIHMGMGLCAGMPRSCVQAVLNPSRA